MNPWAARLDKPPTTESTVKAEVLTAIGDVTIENELINGKISPELISVEDERISDSRKLSQLVDANFPFDESQLAAINGMIAENYACITGAAGTGKTTTTKKLVDELQNQLPIDYINMKEYFKRGSSAGDAEDDYEIPDSFIPAIALVGFTGRSAQMIKKNFPRDWHSNIMTIHRLLAFVPEYYEDFDDSEGEYRKKMRFVPTYTAGCLLPWDIVIIDEAGMVGMDLWNQLWDAMKPGARIYMIGDINQLPPVHGRSIFGFAMAKWPSFELTHIHRQVGENNAIVESAWNILKGVSPESGGKFQMLELKGDAQAASRQVRALIPKFVERGFFDPMRDTIITPINGNEGSRGFALGQLPLNAEFSRIFNPANLNPRYIIDGGREKKMFAVGDKVMATKNDHEAGITNGMTGIITSIVANGGYGGDRHRFGTVEEVNAWINANEEMDDGKDFSLEELSESFEAIDEGKEAGKEKRDRGPASHIVSVRFGDSEHGFELPFASLSEVGSLMTAYVVTCHKMQGGESPTVVIICHDAHGQMLYREWLYTAVTRASQKCILLYTNVALAKALNKQNIKGTTLKQKIESFNLLQKDNGAGVAIKVRLPNPLRFGDTRVVEAVAEPPEEGTPWDDEDTEEYREDDPESVDANLPAVAEAREVAQNVPQEIQDAEFVEVTQVVEKPEPEIREVHHHHTTIVVNPILRMMMQKQQPVRNVSPEPPPTQEKAREIVESYRQAYPAIAEAAKPLLVLSAPEPAPDPYVWVEPESTFVKPAILTSPMPTPAKPLNAWAKMLEKKQ